MDIKKAFQVIFIILFILATFQSAYAIGGNFGYGISREPLVYGQVASAPLPSSNNGSDLSPGVMTDTQLPTLSSSNTGSDSSCSSPTTNEQKVNAHPKYVPRLDGLSSDNTIISPDLSISIQGTAPRVLTPIATTGAPSINISVVPELSSFAALEVNTKGQYTANISLSRIESSNPVADLNISIQGTAPRVLTPIAITGAPSVNISVVPELSSFPTLEVSTKGQYTSNISLSRIESSNPVADLNISIQGTAPKFLANELIYATESDVGILATGIENFVVGTDKTSYNQYEIITIGRGGGNSGDAVDVTEKVLLVNSSGSYSSLGQVTWSICGLCSFILPDLYLNATFYGTNYRIYSQISSPPGSIPPGSILAYDYSNYFDVVASTTAHGYVKDSTGNGISGVKMKLEDCSGNEVASYITDGNGYYSITADAGYYKLVAEYLGYRIVLTNCIELVGDVEFSDVVFSAGLSGYIRYSNGTGVSGVSVRMETCGGVVVDIAVTDANGYYRVQAADAGSFDLVVEYLGYDRLILDCVVVVGEMAVTDVVFSAGLSGYIRYSNGTGVSGVSVRMETCGGVVVDTAVTDANGYYRVQAADAGSFDLVVEYLGYDRLILDCVVVVGEMAVTDVVFSAGLSGYIRYSNGTGVSGVSVRMETCGGVVVDIAVTDANGYYRVQAADAGSFDLVVEYLGYDRLILDCVVVVGEMAVTDVVFYASLEGYVKDSSGVGKSGITMRLETCGGVVVDTAVTDANGYYNLHADDAGYYQLIMEFWGYDLLRIDCTPLVGSYIVNDIVLSTTIHGYLKDLDNNPLVGFTVELYDCSDQLITSGVTDPSGHFSITTDAGKYKIIIVINGGYRLRLVDGEGNDCFLLVGDVDIGVLNINPTPDCSIYNYLCNEGNTKLFDCYWDDVEEGCFCYYTECLYGCTDGLPECDPAPTGTIYVDVDNINDNNNPLPGALVYLDSEYKGTTDSLGRKSLDAIYGYRDVKAECPDGTPGATTMVYVDGNEYVYMDIACEVPEQTGDVLIDLTVIADNTYQGEEYLYLNGRPIADVYLDLNGQRMGLTDLAGQLYLDDIGYGSHNLEFYFCIKDSEDQEACSEVKYGTVTLEVNQSDAVKYFGVDAYELLGSSSLNVSQFAGNRDVISISNYTRQYSEQFICGGICVGIVVVGSAALIGWDTYNVYDCADKYPFDFDSRWECWDEVGWLGLNFVPVGAVSKYIAKGVVVIGNSIKYLPKIGKLTKPVTQISDNVFEIVAKYGDETITYRVEYVGGSKTIRIVDNAAGVLLKNADEAADAVKLVYNAGDDFAQIGSKTVYKGEIKKVGDLGEIMSDEFVEQIIKNADEGIEITVKSGTPGQQFATTQNYIFKFGEDGRNIEIFKKSGQSHGEIDRLLEINGKPVIVESKTGKFDNPNFKDELLSGPFTRKKIDPIKELYNDIDPELVLNAPKDQVSQVASHEFVTQLKGRVIPYATTNAEFQGVRRAWGL